MRNNVQTFSFDLTNFILSFFGKHLREMFYIGK